MLSFRDWLIENEFNNTQEITPEQILEKCSEWFSIHKEPLFRGDDILHKMVSDHPIILSPGSRVSRNTSHHYQTIFDNHPKYKSYPKRTNCLITSTKKKNVISYGKPVIIIPVNGTKLAWTSFYDMWETPVIIAGVTRGIEEWNNLWDGIDSLSKDWKSWVEFKDLEKFKNSARNLKINFNEEKLNVFFKNFGKNVQAAYDPSKLKISLVDVSDKSPIISNSGQEVYFDNQFVVMTEQQYNRLYEK